MARFQRLVNFLRRRETNMNRDSGNAYLNNLLRARKQLLDKNIPEKIANVFTIDIGKMNYDNLSEENKEYIKRNFKSVNLVGD